MPISILGLLAVISYTFIVDNIVALDITSPVGCERRYTATLALDRRDSAVSRSSVLLKTFYSLELRQIVLEIGIYTSSDSSLLIVTARPQMKPATLLRRLALQTLYIFVLLSARLRRNLIYRCV